MKSESFTKKYFSEIFICTVTQKNFSMIEFLCKYTKIPENDLRTGVYVASTQENQKLINHLIEMIKLEKNANKNLKIINRGFQVKHAAQTSNWEALRSLIEDGEVDDYIKYVAIFLAIKEKKTELVDILSKNLNPTKLQEIIESSRKRSREGKESSNSSKKHK